MHNRNFIRETQLILHYSGASIRITQFLFKHSATLVLFHISNIKCPVILIKDSEIETEWTLKKIPGYKLSGNNLGISSVSALFFLIRNHNQNLVTNL